MTTIAYNSQLNTLRVNIENKISVFSKSYKTTNSIVDYLLQIDYVKSLVRIDKDTLKFTLQFDSEGSTLIFENNIKPYLGSKIEIAYNGLGAYYILKKYQNHEDELKSILNQAFINYAKFLFSKNLITKAYLI